MSEPATHTEVEHLLNRHAAALPHLDRLRAVVRHPDSTLTHTPGSLPAQHFLDIYRARRRLEAEQTEPRPSLVLEYDRFLERLQSCNAAVGCWRITFRKQYVWTVFEDANQSFLSAFEHAPSSPETPAPTAQSLLSAIPWFAQVGTPTTDAVTLGCLDELATLLSEQPDTIFAHPYTDPYESLCVADHNVAETLPQPSDLKEAVSVTYSKAFEFLPFPEFAGLLSEDVQTLAVLAHCGVLTGFSEARFAWYRRGRIPWGYLDAYPDGRWVIW